jgi:hypothetical protein
VTQWTASCDVAADRPPALTPGGSVKKKKLRLVEPVDPGVTFSDFGGNEALLCDICMLLAHLKHPEMYRYRRYPVGNKQLSVSASLGFTGTWYHLCFIQHVHMFSKAYRRLLYKVHVLLIT